MSIRQEKSGEEKAMAHIPLGRYETEKDHWARMRNRKCACARKEENAHPLTQHSTLAGPGQWPAYEVPPWLEHLAVVTHEPEEPPAEQLSAKVRSNG